MYIPTLSRSLENSECSSNWAEANPKDKLFVSPTELIPHVQWIFQLLIQVTILYH